MVHASLRSLIFVALLSLTNCGTEETTQSRVGRPPFTEQSIGSCQTSPQDGEQAELPLQSTEFVSSQYFEKEFDYDFFTSALKSQTLHLVDTLFARGVQFYKVTENDQASCRYFGFLPPANSEYTKLWQDQGGLQGPNSSLLGLFRAQFKRHSSGVVELINPTIILREDTDRWTLLHEQTHYLFASARTLTPNMLFVEELRKENNSLFREIQKLESLYKAKPSKETAEKLFTKFDRYLWTNQELFLRGPIEEFTIESLLVEHSRENLIFYLEQTQNHWQVAYDYMRTNIDPVYMSYRALQSKVKFYQNTLLLPAHAEQISQWNQTYRTLEEYRLFITEKVREVEELLPSPQLGMRRNSQGHSHFDLEILREQVFLIQSL